jgi:uncharacterized protein with FMN-binding domain
MKQSGSGSSKKVANGLVAMSCAGVLAVYAAGYVRTRSAADQFDAQSFERRAAAPEAPRTELVSPESRHLERRPMPRESVAETRSPRPVEEAENRSEVKRFVEPARAAEVPAASTAPVLIEVPEVSSPVPPTAPAPVASASAIAAPVIAPPPVVAPPPTPKWKDGTYYGWGTSRHGDIQAEVVIAGGRIAAATISQCRTRYPCSVIDPLPPQVAQRQSPEVDYISRATQSTNAFYYAVVEALNKAK